LREDVGQATAKRQQALATLRAKRITTVVCVCGTGADWMPFAAEGITYVTHTLQDGHAQAIRDSEGELAVLVFSFTLSFSSSSSSSASFCFLLFKMRTSREGVKKSIESHHDGRRGPVVIVARLLVVSKTDPLCLMYRSYRKSHAHVLSDAPHRRS
jgi:hypothetical protein